MMQQPRLLLDSTANPNLVARTVGHLTGHQSGHLATPLDTAMARYHLHLHLATPVHGHHQ